MGGAIRAGVWAVVALVAAGGCGRADKLRYEKSFALPEEGAFAKVLNLPPQSAAQTVRIEVSADQPVDVFVMAAKDAPDLEKLTAGEWESKSLTFKRAVTGETLTANIPAKQETAVVVSLGAKTVKAQVKVKMTN
jgi:hypothetical protein